ncbi:MFS transporter [Providencia stuartii]|uniref:MFS transporter n=1 Tax=Providencia stuartii TaxID=588 RepID=UPI00201FE7D8|nr:MFS transporter [Providencia stuartii]ELR5043413.1 MFS transporter [Providencia rettgeri]URE79294.1 MFS transporter [Providencia stuartii]
MPKNVWWLTIALALFTTGNAIVLSVAVVIGESLSQDPTYSTLPLLSQYIGLIIATIPIAYLMQKHSRKLGFILGDIAGIIGATLSIIGIIYHHLAYFSLGLFFTGIAIGTAKQFRFAALEEAPKFLHAKAIGLVMSGGIAAALIGPTLAVVTQRFFTEYPFAGPFSTLVGIYMLAFILLLNIPLKKIPPEKQNHMEVKRSYKQLYSQPILKLIAIVSAVGYALVVFTFASIPLSMKQNHFPFPLIAIVFQCHVLGMFAPSFFTGHLIQRLGAKKIIFVGILLLILSATINLLGTEFYHYLLSGISVGVAWNLLLISTTQLLPYGYQSHERAKVQGMTDFLIYSFGALGSLGAGVLFFSLGWQLMNTVSIIFALFILSSYVVLKKHIPQ